MTSLRGVAGRALLSGALLCAAGCATYSDRMESVRVATSDGDYRGGVEQIDDLLDVKDAELPDDWGGEQGLLVLERATLEQALEEWELSARDLGYADKELEYLDIAGDTAGTIGKYMFSDSATKFKTSPTEKLSLNAVNMLNYLALGDLAGARVEAKRFTVMRNYLVDFDEEHAHGPMGSYLAGFVYEQLGESGSALRYYDEALAFRRLDSLREPVQRLAKRNPYRGEHLTELLEDGAALPASPDPAGNLLVVVAVGRVPHKVPERMPIGLAVGIAGTWISGNAEVLERSALKYVVYPELVDSESGIQGVSATVDGEAVSLELVADLGKEVRSEYEAIKPKIIGAAISRMIVRAAAAEGAREAGRSAGGSGGDVLGTIFALITEGLMVAADKPDTRSWELLPDRVYAYRRRVSPGRREVSVQLGGSIPEVRRVDVDIPTDGYAIVVVTAPR